jgi:hypothetical protein
LRPRPLGQRQDARRRRKESRDLEAARGEGREVFAVVPELVLVDADSFGAQLAVEREVLGERQLRGGVLGD